MVLRNVRCIEAPVAVESYIRRFTDLPDHPSPETRPGSPLHQPRASLLPTAGASWPGFVPPLPVGLRLDVADGVRGAPPPSLHPRCRGPGWFAAQIPDTVVARGSRGRPTSPHLSDRLRTRLGRSERKGLFRQLRRLRPRANPGCSRWHRLQTAERVMGGFALKSREVSYELPIDRSKHLLKLLSHERTPVTPLTSLSVIYMVSMWFHPQSGRSRSEKKVRSIEPFVDEATGNGERGWEHRVTASTELA